MFLNLRKATAGDQVLASTKPSHPPVFHQAKAPICDLVPGTPASILLPPLNVGTSSRNNDWYAEIVDKFDRDVQSWFDGERDA